jgi:hypothetical protein
MPHLAATTLTGAALAALLPTGTAVAAAPPQHGRAAAAGTLLTLTVTHPEALISGSRTVTLRCDPPGGTHPEAAGACADLARTHGRIVRNPGETICTLEYRPLTANATGMWRGRPVAFAMAFPNSCVMHARTGAIFRF